MIFVSGIFNIIIKMHTMLQGNHNLSALMQQHHLLSNSNHNQVILEKNTIFA